MQYDTDRKQVKVFEASVSDAKALGAEVDQFLENKVMIQLETNVAAGSSFSKYTADATVVITVVYKNK